MVSELQRLKVQLVSSQQEGKNPGVTKSGMVSVVWFLQAS